MGTGRWDGETTRAYAASTSIRSTQSREQIFTRRHINEALDPAKVVLRESRDSENNPNSTAIIIGLDVTGSMGVIAEKLAKGKLGKLMEGIFERRPVADPQIMVMGIGDIHCDRAPLQVSQFEVDIKIDESLQNVFLEGGGGGNDSESYDLPWYFAASRTSTDCFEKRGKKGYLITIGDEMPPTEKISKAQFESVFGKTQDIPSSQSEALEAAQKTFDVFHVIVEQGNYARGARGQHVIGAWRELLGSRAIPLDNWENITEVMIAAMELNEGKTLEEVVDSQTSSSTRQSVQHAFG